MTDAMNKMVTLTVVIRTPVYARLVTALAAFPDARARAGLLKRLAEEGAIAACSSMPASVAEPSRIPIVPLSKDASQQFDIRVVIREEEFPHLYSALERERNSRARAALLKRFAENALRWQGSERTPSEEKQVGFPVRKQKMSTADFDLNSVSLSLSDGAVPLDLLAGFGGAEVG
jgi:hypothetical protein